MGKREDLVRLLKDFFSSFLLCFLAIQCGFLSLEEQKNSFCEKNSKKERHFLCFFCSGSPRQRLELGVQACRGKPSVTLKLCFKSCSYVICKLLDEATVDKTGIRH